MTDNNDVFKDMPPYRSIASRIIFVLGFHRDHIPEQAIKDLQEIAKDAHAYWRGEEAQKLVDNKELGLFTVYRGPAVLPASPPRQAEPQNVAGQLEDMRKDRDLQERNYEECCVSLRVVARELEEAKATIADMTQEMSSLKQRKQLIEEPLHLQLQSVTGEKAALEQMVRDVEQVLKELGIPTAAQLQCPVTLRDRLNALVTKLESTAREYQSKACDIADHRDRLKDELVRVRLLLATGVSILLAYPTGKDDGTWIARRDEFVNNRTKWSIYGT